jgi:Fe-S cluster assembly protein SufD
MIAVNESQDLYLSSFSQLEKKLPGSGQDWIDQIRKDAIHRFAELGFPTTHHEEWKYTSVAPIARIPFQAAPAGAKVSPSLRGVESPRLVFVNGHYSPELSSLRGLPQGVTAGHLGAALANPVNGFASLEEHLARYASFTDHAFVALNTAFMADGAFIEIAKDTVLEQPVHLLYLSTATGRPAVTHPRNLILVGRGCQASFVESYVGPDSGSHSLRPGGTPSTLTSGEGVYFTNAVTELVAGEGAVINYCKVQEESLSAFHIATLQVEQARSSNVTTYSIALGGALVREKLNAVLDGDGAECLLNGLYVIAGKQHVDNHTVIDHAKPHCGSRELYKGVLDGKSTGVFNGKIIVRKDAQKTDSKQSNKNLLLSEDATINTKPQLEIFADDVKCTHGATIGQVDQEAIFYLRSRGIALAEARRMLVQAFADDVIDKIKFAPWRERLRGALLERLVKKQGAGA